MTTILSVLTIACVIVAFYIAKMFRDKNLGIWVWEYAAQQRRPRYRPQPGEDMHVLFCHVDHFEPLAGPTKAVERERIRAWVEEYPKLARSHKDSDGKPPQHTWFYPGEQYDEECLDELSKLTRAGFGEIEVHLHHGYDIPERLTAKLHVVLANFSRHGITVTAEDPPRVAYGFIHGNLGLSNSRGAHFCGVNSELLILRETGCYADFSLPNAPCESQTKKINAVYYATNIPGRPKSHDNGIDVEVGRPPQGDLMIIQGPLALDWSNRKFGIFPRIENGELSSPPTPSRIRLWVSQHIHVKGRPNWIIVKISCHGAEDDKRDLVLGKSADQMFTCLEKEYRDRPGYALHYVTARELYNIIKAAEAREKGNPGQFRDYVIPRYRSHAPASRSVEEKGFGECR